MTTNASHDSAPAGHFTAPDRKLGEEDRIELTSVGVDIGSSTSHLIFSRLELEREDNRYVTVARVVLFESEILLTPYLSETTVDGEALGRFINRQYQFAGIEREAVDTGALILTGVALLRENARAIGELFSQEAGKFVAVSAGDNLEATMAAHGSGAVGLSAHYHQNVMNVDIGGGTTKIVVCSDGHIRDVAAVDVGARLVVCDEQGAITRLEPAGRQVGQAVGLDLELGRTISEAAREAMANYMADQLMLALTLGSAAGEASVLMRTPPVEHGASVDALMFSGGVSEFIYGHERKSFGDLGALLAQAIKERVERLGLPIHEPAAGIRATVIGASQYTVQVSGSTIYLSPPDVVPIRNIPVVTPDFRFGEDDIDAAAVQRAVHAALTRFDLLDADTPVAVGLRWQGSATYGRIQAFCSGVVGGMQKQTADGHPVVLVCDGDIGGLLGLHFRDEMKLTIPVISIDGIDLREFDFVDIGALIPASGAVPVVIKSLVFPASAAKRR